MGISAKKGHKKTTVSGGFLLDTILEYIKIE